MKPRPYMDRKAEARSRRYREAQQRRDLERSKLWMRKREKGAEAADNDEREDGTDGR